MVIVGLIGVQTQESINISLLNSLHSNFTGGLYYVKEKT